MLQLQELTAGYGARTIIDHDSKSGTYLGGQRIPANQPITEAITFLAIDVLDYSGASILNGNNAYQVPNNQGQVVAGSIGLQTGSAAGVVSV